MDGSDQNGQLNGVQQIPPAPPTVAPPPVNNPQPQPPVAQSVPAPQPTFVAPPTDNQGINQPAPTEPAPQVRPPLQLDQIYATPGVEQVTDTPNAPDIPEFKSGGAKLPDSVYIVAGAMFVPLLILLQLLYISPKGMSSLINASVTQPSGFDNFILFLWWVTFIALGASAVMLIIYRRKITWTVAMMALAMTSVCLIKPIFDSIGSYFKYKESQSSSPYASIMAEYSGIAERSMQIVILDELLLFTLPIVAGVYLNKPRVKDAYR